MVGARHRSHAVTAGVLALLLASGLAGCAEGSRATPSIDPPGVAGNEPVLAIEDPTVVDSSGMPLEPGHAAVVQSVYEALREGDLEELRSRYRGDNWAGQAELLARQRVRDEVLGVLLTHPANLGEGYVYPGFSVTGWTGMLDRSDGARLGLTPDDLPDPTTGYLGYQTAFFLEPQEGAPLTWRGIARLPGVTAAG